MKISKSILESALGLVSQKIAQHSPQGNYVTVNESKEAEGHLWQAGEHKKAAEKHEPNSKQWHAAMAAHHESKAEYYHHKGMRDLSDKHADKAEAHLMKMHESVEIDESLMEGTVTVVRKDNGGHHRITVGKTDEGETFVSSKFDTSSDPKKPSGNGSSQNLANYVDSRHGDGTAKKRAKLHSALVAAHATGDKKKVLDAVKAHGYSHHDWQLHEGTELPADKGKWTAQDFRKHLESKNSKKTPQDKEHEAWERKYNANRVNESEKYTDENGVTWNDEGDSDHGHTNWGRGPMNHYGARRYRSGYRKPAAQKPAAQKHYHSVPYKDKEHAKGEGMKWDGDKRKWYHTDAGKSATSKFKKLTEEEDLSEAQNPYKLYNGAPGFKAAHDAIHHAVLNAAKDPGAVRRAMRKHKDLGATDTESRDTIYHHIKKHHGVEVAKKTGILNEEEKSNGGFDHRKAAMAGVMHSDDAPHMKLNMQHDFYSSKNGDKIQGTVHTVSKDRVVLKANKQHHKDHGKFHTFKFATSYDRMNEETLDEVKEDLEIFTEEHATREQAEKRMSEIEKKHPMAKHTVMQGRRSGKWHVVRHTGGGMHVVESVESVEDLLEGAADAKTPLQKHVHKMWTGKKHYAGITAGGEGHWRGTAYKPRPGIKHSVAHHEDGSSTVTFHHSDKVPHGYHDNQTHAVARAIDSFREAHGHEHNHSQSEALNNKTSTQKDGYQAHKVVHPMTIHTKTEGGVTKMHIKPHVVKEDCGLESKADLDSKKKAADGKVVKTETKGE